MQITKTLKNRKNAKNWINKKQETCKELNQKNRKNAKNWINKKEEKCKELNLLKTGKKTKNWINKKHVSHFLKRCENLHNMLDLVQPLHHTEYSWWWREMILFHSLKQGSQCSLVSPGSPGSPCSPGSSGSPCSPGSSGSPGSPGSLVSLTCKTHKP